MKFNDHSRLVGCHAFLSASQFHWIHYDEEKLIDRYNTYMAAERGTKLHDFAAQAITLRQRLKGTSSTLALYVNDAIGYNMTPEQVLYYSEYCFGTADAISFRNNFLRIHDLKTGEIPVMKKQPHIEQLEVYAALFCLEYNVDPNTIDIELRIYQSNEVNICNPEKTDILYIMDKIKRFDSKLKEIEEGAN
jgi:hypothetical protein